MSGDLTGEAGFAQIELATDSPLGQEPDAAMII